MFRSLFNKGFGFLTLFSQTSKIAEPRLRIEGPQALSSPSASYVGRRPFSQSFLLQSPRLLLPPPPAPIKPPDCPPNQPLVEKSSVWALGPSEAGFELGPVPPWP